MVTCQRSYPITCCQSRACRKVECRGSPSSRSRPPDHRSSYLPSPTAAAAAETFLSISPVLRPFRSTMAHRAVLLVHIHTCGHHIAVVERNGSFCSAAFPMLACSAISATVSSNGRGGPVVARIPPPHEQVNAHHEYQDVVMTPDNESTHGSRPFLAYQFMVLGDLPRVEDNHPERRIRDATCTDRTRRTAVTIPPAPIGPRSISRALPCTNLQNG